MNPSTRRWFESPSRPEPAVDDTHTAWGCDAGPPYRSAMLCSRKLLLLQVACRHQQSIRRHGHIRLGRRHPGATAAAYAHHRRRTGRGVLLRQGVRGAPCVSRRGRTTLARRAGHQQPCDAHERELRACTILLRRVASRFSTHKLSLNSIRRQNSAICSTVNGSKVTGSA